MSQLSYSRKKVVGGVVCASIGAVAVSIALLGASALAEESSSSSADSPDAGVTESSVDAQQWSEQFPDEYDSWWLSMSPGTNQEQTDSDYTWSEKMGKPAAWVAAIKSGSKIGNGCLSCHSTSFVTMYEEYGGDLVTLDENTLKTQASEGITCYSCHGDTPGEMYVSKQFIADAIEQSDIETDESNLVCAQCHGLPVRAWKEELGSTEEDRSFGIMGDTDTSHWSTLSVGTDANDVYDYFVSLGIKNPKVVIGEMEFNQYYGSTMEQAGATCADCHMEQATDDQGNQYARHAWQGAEVNPAIYENCLSCHTDSTAEEMQAEVEEIQEAYRSERDEVGALVDEAQAAIEASDADEATIQEATDLWYKMKFDYRYGQDSSEGIHGIGNPNTDYCWDDVRSLHDQIMELV
jgi:nitrite reductase (cytochrome c-552)